MKEKIHKVLARAGLGSRREIERWILDDRVRVNGRPATLGVRVSTEDRVQVDGKLVATRGPGTGVPNVIMYHKPEGEVCTRAGNEKRPTVYRSLPAVSNARWVSVGRLDLNTSGLLLFTDDGDLANKLMHPSTGLEREYLVRVRGPIEDEAIRKLMAGVSLDGREARFDTVSRMGRSEGQNRWFRVVIREGRNREVRRLWEKVGYQVSRLKRIRYGTIRLPKDLKQGRYTKLAPAQLEKLLRTAGFTDRMPGRGRRRDKRSDEAPIRRSPATPANRRARRRR
jgi:23S rRNA pseudouridine2605 synthase